MLRGRYLLLSIIMKSGLNAVPTHAETIQVTIDKLVYSPVEIKAKVDDTIEWINKDIIAHTATVRGDWDVTIAANSSASVVLKNGRHHRLLLPLSSQHEGAHHYCA